MNKHNQSSGSELGQRAGTKVGPLDLDQLAAVGTLKFYVGPVQGNNRKRLACFRGQ